MKRYRLIPTGYSSQRYGPCEVCKQPATEVFHQIEERTYVLGWTRYKCHDLFGHKQCLVAARSAK